MHLDVSQSVGHQAYNFLNGLVAPRPIAWITTIDGEGIVNAAPFSAYNYVGTDPPLVAIGISNRPGGLTLKDTIQNIRVTGEFVVNVVNEEVAEAMNICAVDFPHGVSELEKAGLHTAPSLKIKTPRIAEAPASLECRQVTTLDIGRNHVLIGEVLAFYVRDEFVDPSGPYIRADLLHAIGRMNAQANYVKTRDAFFQMERMKLADWEKKQQDGQQ